MKGIRTQARGLLDTITGRHARARALAIVDSRSLVRSLWLASAVRLEVLPLLRTAQPFEAIVRSTGATRTERLEAWLELGVELGELARPNDRFVVSGVRARALADGDVLLAAHFRSMLDYQAGPYEQLSELLRGDAGRPDLVDHASVIAQVSLAAAPFVIPYLRQVIGELQPRRVLDVGCGTGVYLQAELESDPRLEADAIDLSPDVIDLARDRLRAAGLEARARLHVGDVRSWTPSLDQNPDLITLLNNIYYFDRSSRPDLYRQLGAHLTSRGELVVVTMATPGSMASAHLHFMLTCQAGQASLPRQGEIEADLEQAGFVVVDATRLVPTEPFVGIRARRAPLPGAF
jgi:SAM-dependent methyltransferase